jgi:hypothetical protein
MQNNKFHFFNYGYAKKRTHQKQRWYKQNINLIHKIGRSYHKTTGIDHEQQCHKPN